MSPMTRPMEFRANLEALELSWEEAQGFLGKLDQYWDIAKSVLEDPALPQVVDRAKKLQAIAKSAPKAAGAPEGSRPGIGLGAAIRPLDLFILYRQKPWILPVGIGAVLAVPALLGYFVGRRRGRKACAR